MPNIIACKASSDISNPLVGVMRIKNGFSQRAVTVPKAAKLSVANRLPFTINASCESGFSNTLFMVAQIGL